jgi:hypothetical protein
MTEEKRCNRCGECCSYLPLFTQHMHPEYRKFLLMRGLKEDTKQGCILIPHICQHLGFKTDGKTKEYFCDIHNDPNRPEVCSKFHGQKFLKNARIYIPPGCAFAKEK